MQKTIVLVLAFILTLFSCESASAKMPGPNCSRYEAIRLGRTYTPGMAAARGANPEIFAELPDETDIPFITDRWAEYPLEVRQAWLDRYQLAARYHLDDLRVLIDHKGDKMPLAKDRLRAFVAEYKKIRPRLRMMLVNAGFLHIAQKQKNVRITQVIHENDLNKSNQTSQGNNDPAIGEQKRLERDRVERLISNREQEIEILLRIWMRDKEEALAPKYRVWTASALIQALSLKRSSLVAQSNLIQLKAWDKRLNTILIKISGHPNKSYVVAYYINWMQQREFPDHPESPRLIGQTLNGASSDISVYQRFESDVPNEARETYLRATPQEKISIVTGQLIAGIILNTAPRSRIRTP